MGFAGLDEEGFVFAGGDDLAVEIVGELGDEDGVRELLEEDWREIEVAVKTDAVALQIFEDAEEREIGFSCGFVEPLHAVRPSAVIDDIGQMRMQGEGEKSCRAVCRCLRQDRVPQGIFSRGSVGVRNRTDLLLLSLHQLTVGALHHGRGGDAKFAANSFDARSLAIAAADLEDVAAGLE
jgi:hypothetical protein